MLFGNPRRRRLARKFKGFNLMSSPTGAMSPPAMLPSGGKADGRARNWNWLGVLPFFAFAMLFLILPTSYLMVGAFQDGSGAFTLANIRGLFEANVLSAYWISIRISAASAIGGGLLGFLLAWPPCKANCRTGSDPPS